MISPLITRSPGFWPGLATIAVIVISSSTGELFTAAAMKSIGDVGKARVRDGLGATVRAVLTSPMFIA